MKINSLLLLLIPLLPFLGFVINGFFNKKLSKSLVGIVACGSILISFLISICLFVQLATGLHESFAASYFTWIHAGDLNITFSFLVDHLSAVMLLVITGVGFLIHVYSVGYMSHDEDAARYFSYLNLFVFFMLLLVMGSNYVVMFTGWEGVGLCSYLLIGFWFKNTAYNNAAKKAFIMNRIGDLGFLLGMFLMFQRFGSLDFANVFSGAKSVTTGDYTVTTICILMFIGAMGKSAQIPLYTWLPDAMAGPTPVSALIHAATMVTAGIYMIARTNILYTLSPIASQMVAVVGVATAFFAATIGLKQNDIKKVLAYSTVSQLGFMFVALGVGAYTTGMFHVVTHAFFKALLFLCAGSVIHAMSGEQDIRRMGGLKKKLPITHLTFLTGTLAITGVPVFAGFFSKDEILAKVYASGNMFMFFMLSVTTVITAIYMFRLYWLTFYGEFRGSHHQQEHLHESPPSMTMPLVVLAILSTVGGFLGMPAIFNAPHFLNNFLEPSIYFAGTIVSETSHAFEYTLIAGACIALVIVIFGTFNYYVKQNVVPEEDEQLKALPKVVSNKYYVDELYENFITKPLQFTSQSVYKYIEKMVIDGAVNGMGWLTNNVSASLRLIQSGRVGLYVFSMTIGIILILAIKFLF